VDSQTEHILNPIEEFAQPEFHCLLGHGTHSGMTGPERKMGTKG